MSTPGYKLRLITKDDHPSIFSDWLRSGRKARAFVGITSQVYFFWQHLVVERLLDPDAQCVWLVACAADDPTKIYGWLCGSRADSLAGDQAILHYVYVKKLYRRLGIARRLVEALRGSAEVLVITCLTDAVRALLHDQPFLYNPFLAFIWTPASAPKRRGKDHPHVVSRRTLSAGGFAPEEAEEDPDGPA
jgi:GNAT superfamily N-acetyltransferase